jgi:hypothetical protein
MKTLGPRSSTTANGDWKGWPRAAAADGFAIHEQFRVKQSDEASEDWREEMSLNQR